MRGVILAGGTGSRLAPLTDGVNKHVLHVGGVPMIYHPLRVLRDNGIVDITIVSSPSGVGQLAALLGSGADHGCCFTYRVQDKPGGIAEALGCVVAVLDAPVPMAVILGDNVFAPSPEIDLTISADSCRVFLTKVPDLSGFGVPFFNEWGITGVVEKPVVPPSEYAVTGLYVFSHDVFKRLAMLKPSERGELEITSLLNTYAADRKLLHSFVPEFWGDAGMHDGMKECAFAYEAYKKWKGKPCAS